MNHPNQTNIENPNQDNECTDDQPSNQPPMNPNKMAGWVKRFIDIAWYASVVSLIVWPIAILVIGYSIPTNPDERHTDINFYLNFTVYPEASSAELMNKPDELSKVSEVIKGQGNIKINNTKSVSAWYLAGAITEITGLIGLLALWYLRKIFKSLEAGDSFNQNSPVYLEKVGYITITASVIWTVLQYFGGKMILNDIGQHAATIHLSPAFQPNIGAIFIGLATIVLAGIIKEATLIHEDQALTI
jgi:hypothetical protein